MAGAIAVNRTKVSSRRRIRFKLSSLLSPYTFVVFVAASAALLTIPNELGWGLQYGTFAGAPVMSGYVAALVLGLVVVRIWSALTRKSTVVPSLISPQWLKCLFICACIFTIAKFINVRDIPLFGDPMSRYRHTIGGYADYFARLITPLALLYFYKFQKSRYRDYGALGAILLSIALSGLFMQRQDVLFVVIGCMTMWAWSMRLRLDYAVVITSALAAAAYIIVGLGAVARYGAATLGGGIPTWLLPVWVIHGEITVPYLLGDFVTRHVDELLLGRYSLGEYFTLTGNDISIGAGYINENFVGAQTAQSIGAPYGFILDFGGSGAIVMGFLTGIILGFGYKSFRNPNAGPLAMAVYPLLLLYAFWSVRSGTFLVGSMALFGFFAFMVVTTGGSRSLVLIRTFVRPLFLGALALAAATLVIRI